MADRRTVLQFLSSNLPVRAHRKTPSFRLSTVHSTSSIKKIDEFIMANPLSIYNNSELQAVLYGKSKKEGLSLSAKTIKDILDIIDEAAVQGMSSDATVIISSSRMLSVEDASVIKGHILATEQAEHIFFFRLHCNSKPPWSLCHSLSYFRWYQLQFTHG